MDNAELGKRLKAARLAKKMTQSDVVGNFITRNMLSQIESGNAMPSMKTLEYLSGVLELPLEKLLAEGDISETAENSTFSLVHAKQLLRENKFEELLKSCVPEGIIEDEIHALRSIAHLSIAQRLAESEETEALQSAVIHARNAAREAELGVYKNDARAAQANQLIARIAQYLSSYYSNLADTAG
ncbi:MAG: helix-turn-helix domain-containing protein [Oscillospiraceae bacterium]|nr:helix-turn-helix domain-containing protein [Oscillospiraceae bacterium]